MIKTFISVGENIHCTRKYKVGGKQVETLPGGRHGIPFKDGGKARHLPVPPHFCDGAEWKEGHVRHCAVAIWQGVYGKGEEQKAGIDYIKSLAAAQEKSGATYLDLNVDEFSTDVAERVKLMKWTAKTVQEASPLPLSIDSSNTEILRAGLAACDRSRPAPMLNSVSLERIAALDLMVEFNAVAIVSAAGESDLPCTTEGRLANLDRMTAKLRAARVADERIHFDPLVFPMSTDPSNGKLYLEAVSEVRKKYGPKVHMAAGLSNISFGMPNRKLLNQVFTYLTVEAGGDGGIVDPLQINKNILNSLDVNSESFKLARAALVGEDEFGMNYITACREGTI